MPGSGDTLRYTNVQTSSLGNYTQTGTNFNWDFRSVVSTTSGIRAFKSALQTPYAFYFLNTSIYGEKLAGNLLPNTGTLSISDYYNFYKKSTSPNAFLADGVGLSISSIPVAAYYSDKDELYNFPMSYPKYDSTTFKFSTPSTSLLPITYTRRGSRVTKVDGWGTVTTPFGTENCLRLKTTQYSQDTMAISLSTLIPMPIKIGFQNNTLSYQWLTSTSKIPFMEITGNLIGNNFVITQARYRGYDKNANLVSISKQEAELSEVELYPNPVKDKLWLHSGIGEIATVQILDVNGRLIRKGEANQFDKVASIDVADLSTGLYIIKIEQGAKQTQLKFIKE
jgi:Secretion system C-terminal sorting domain